MAKKKVSSRASASVARVRMYRHGLGDCFLLRFPGDGETFNILIDCGLIAVAANPKPTMQKVVADIASECAGHLHLVIMTHEHWDHASGFSTQQVQDAFDQLEIDEVWYAWTEDPDNTLGKKLRHERAAKLRALQVAGAALQKRSEPVALERAERIKSLLAFFGVADSAELQALAAAGDAAVGKTRAAFEYLKHRRGVKTRYCYPRKPPVALPGVDGVRVYVLGPPEDEGRIKRSSPTKTGKEVYEINSEAFAVDNLAAAFGRLDSPTLPDAGCPFEESFRISSSRLDQPPLSGQPPPPANLAALVDTTWSKPGEESRQIELDWTYAAETLALNLDNHTNNTCLVVAFELTSSGKVLLFAADAQVGNWLSWQDTQWHVRGDDGVQTVHGPELLERTVFYKVGHHGSHNATLRALGLEQMTSEDLIAFVPVFKEQAEKSRWHEMPFAPLVKRLREKTGGRLVFSDPKQKAPDQDQLKQLSAAQQKAFLKGLTSDPLYYEYSFAL